MIKNDLMEDKYNCMEIVRNDGRYTIKYIGNLSKENLANLLLLFKSKSSDEQLLFEAFCADPYFWNEDMVENDKNYYYQSFLDNTILFHNESTKIGLTDKIITLLQEGYGVKGDQKSILNEFLSGNIVVAEEVIEKVKSLIYETVLTEVNPHVYNFTKDKIVFVNNTWFDMETDKLKSNPLVKVSWYTVQTIEEIIGAIDLTEVYFKCLVHKKNNSFGNYSFALIYYEAESDFHMEVIEVTPGSFEEEVLPKINDFVRDLR